MGEKLTKTGTTVGGILANDIKYPQTITNCVKCHDGTAGAKNQTAQGDNWKTMPNRLTCGSCHDRVNFATGENHVAPDGKSIQTNDSECANCHKAADISTVYHVSVDPTGSVDRGGYPTPASGVGNPIALASMVNPPAGVFKIKFEIASVTVDSARKATVNYRIMKDGAAVTLNTTGFLIKDVDGTPSIYVTYGVPQDGVTKVVDWTASLSASVTQFRDAQTAGNVSATFSQTGPDANGYYSATFKTALPTGAAMVYGAMGINYAGFVQLKGYKVGGVDTPIRLRESAFALVPSKPFVSASNPGDIRRPIVSAENCNNCHAQLGVEPSFHSGARNNPVGCAMGGCHNETKATSHTDGGAWALSEKYMVHGIHGGWKRTIPFTYAASKTAPLGFSEVEYPGVLQNCRQCHLPGSFDFSNATNVNAVPNMLWTTDDASDMRLPPNNSVSATENPSTYVGVSPWITGGKFASNKSAPTVLDRTIVGLGYKDYRIDNVVSSPVASACFGCHDAPKSINHMEQNGGVLVKQISTVTGIAAPSTTGLTAAQITTALNTYRTNLTAANKEACLICHGTGKTADIKVVHGVK
jgi:OmcA/MtrC family decaheme c-type cytochrome